MDNKFLAALPWLMGAMAQQNGGLPASPQAAAAAMQGDPGTLGQTPGALPDFTVPQTPGTPQGQVATPSPFGPSQMQVNAIDPSDIGGGVTPTPPTPTPAQAESPSMWSGVMKMLSGVDENGMPLQGEELANFRQGHTLAGLLSALGSGIGGDTTGGRLSKAVYGQAAGGQAAMNSMQQQQFMNSYLNNILGQPNNPTTAQSASATSSSPLGSDLSASAAFDLDKSLAELDDSLRKLNNLKF